MAEAPLRILMITPTDFSEMWNNVEHSRIRFYRDKGYEVTVLHLKLNRSSRLLHMLRDTLSFRVKRSERDGATFFAVDPWFNYCSGLRRKSDVKQQSSGGRRSLRHRLVRAASVLAVLRDLFFVPSFVLAALLNCRGRYDACLGIGPWASLIGLILRTLGKVRVLVYEDRDYDPGLMPDRLRQSYTAMVERFVQRRAEQLISVGHRLAALRRRESGVEPTVLSNGIDWDRYAPAREAQRTGRVLMYVGYLSSWSGVEQNLQAMPLILDAQPDARLLIVGGGLPDYEQHLRNLAQEMKLGDAVEFLGSQSHERLPELLGRARVGLANSQPVAYRQYACPLKVIEYMAAGLPAVVTHDTEAAEMVARYGCGVATAFDPAAIAQEVIGLFGSPERVEEMRASAIMRSRDLDWSRLLEQELALIRRSLDDKASPAPTSSAEGGVHARMRA